MNRKTNPQSNMTEPRKDSPLAVLRLPDLTAVDNDTTVTKGTTGRPRTSSAFALRSSSKQASHPNTSIRWGKQFAVAVTAAALAGIAIYLVDQERSDDRGPSHVKARESTSIHERNSAATPGAGQAESDPTDVRPSASGGSDARDSRTVHAYEPNADQTHPAASVNLSAPDEVASAVQWGSPSPASIAGPRLVSGDSTDLDREQLVFNSIPLGPPVAKFTGGIIPMPAGGSNP